MAAPPLRPPQKPGLAGRLEGEDAIQKARREKDELEAEASRLEEDLEELKARYEQYFLGIERREPAKAREELRKRVLRVKEAFTRNTGLKFKIQSLHARYLSYERLWLRSAKEKEEGTYRRDIFKARLHARKAPAPPAEPAAAKAAPAAAPAATPAPVAPARPGAPGPQAPATPAGAARPAGAPPVRPGAAAPAAGPAVPRAPTPPPRPAGAMSEPQLRALYDAYVAAKRSCNEDTSRLSYDVVAKTVSRQIPELMTRFKAKSVDFKVEVKDGKAILKAIPKV